MTGPRWRPLWLAVLVIILDRITKHLIERHVEFWEEIKVIPGFFQIVHTRNTGIAFGMFQSAGGESSPMLIAFGLLVMAFMATLFWNASKDPTREHWTLRYGLGLVMGGAVGNLYDRIVIGSVTDFFDFYWRSHHFPIFNVADSAITVGAGLLILNLWTGNKKNLATATN